MLKMKSLGYNKYFEYSCFYDIINLGIKPRKVTKGKKGRRGFKKENIKRKIHFLKNSVINFHPDDHRLRKSKEIRLLKK